MNGIDIIGMLLVVALVCAAVRQHRIDRHDRERHESRTAVKNIMDAIGGWR